MIIVLKVKLHCCLLVVQTFMFKPMFLDMVILLVRNENWPQANLHVTKESKNLKKKKRKKKVYEYSHDQIVR